MTNFSPNFSSETQDSSDALERAPGAAFTTSSSAERAMPSVPPLTPLMPVTPRDTERLWLAACDPHAMPERRDALLQILSSAYRRRVLWPDHVRVLRHYGQRRLPPDPRRWRERRAFYLWQDACRRLTPLLSATRVSRE